MAKKESRRVKTLSSFMKWVAQFNDGQYVLRGVSNKDYEIQASAYRRLPKADRNNLTKLLKINKEMISEARLEGHDLKNG